MDNWFRTIAAGRELPPAVAAALDEAGFAVVGGPITGAGMTSLAAAYDAAVVAADAADRHTGRTGTTRVHDFVNRGAAFDGIYIYAPILEACCVVIRRPFKLSTMLARTLNPHAPAQGLHMDFAPDAVDRQDAAWPMLGFIVMIDVFTNENGATRVVPGSHRWPDPPSALAADRAGHVSACGPAGSVILYNGSVWHGHGANPTGTPRRSIQGAFIRRDAPSGGNLPARMRPDTLARIGALARYLIDDSRGEALNGPVEAHQRDRQ